MTVKVQKRFVRNSFLALCLVFSVLLICLPLLSYSQFIRTTNKNLEMLWSTRSYFIYVDKDLSPIDKDKAFSSPRFFSVMADSHTGEMLRIAPPYFTQDAVSSIEELTKTVVEEGNELSFVKSYRCMAYPIDQNTTCIFFLDCEKELKEFIISFFVILCLCIVGLIVSLSIIATSYHRVIRAFSEDSEKYQRYLVDSGHEFKTPIAIILADVDVLEMELENNEWVRDIRRQAKRLDGLTNDLDLLARMEQSNESMQMIDFPASDVISEAAAAFQMAAAARKISLELKVQPMLSMYGNDKSIHQLVGLLIDNALKYSPDGSQVFLTFELKNSMLQLSVYNESNYLIPKDSLDHLFDRFYRIDHAEDSPTKGYGIGLSLAKAIVNAHKGKIQALSPDGASMQIVVSFPI